MIDNNRFEFSKLPLVCICLPTYNVEATVCETLKSILAQTYSNLVVHVSDNASTDATLEVIESLGDGRVTVHRNDVNIGGEGNFNRCIQLAEGKYTAIFHADDIYEPDMVAKQVAFLESHQQAGAVFTEASLIDDTGKVIGEICLPKDIKAQSGLYDFAMMFKAVLRHSNFLICPSVMVRTRVYQQEIKNWRGDLFKSSADLDVWLRILQHHAVGYLPERLIRYRISNNQWSARVRLATERANFFLVIDHYLVQNSVRFQLDASDLQNYRWLERRDRTMRAVNLCLTDCSAEVVNLTNDFFSFDAICAALQSKRGFFVLILGGYVRLLAIFGWSKIGRISLAYIKRRTGR